MTVLATLGTVLEWAEFSFYGYMAVRISEVFFPVGNSNLAILKTFGIFALGYLTRPIGAILFGHIGDRYGRTPALCSSLALMGIATFLIGCLPGYEHLGIYAPLLLLVLRMLQSASISGEYNGAGIFLIEQAQDRYPCLAGSFVSAAGALGIVIGGGLSYVISLEGMPAWSWRIPFLLGGALCWVGFMMRRGFLAPDKKHAFADLPLVLVWRSYKSSLLFTAAVSAVVGTYFYVCNVYMVVFLQKQVGLGAAKATYFVLLAELVVMFTIPVMAYLADRLDPYAIFNLALLSVALCAPIIFYLAHTNNPLHLYLGMFLFGLTNGALCGPMAKIVADQFPSTLRYTGVGLAWNVAASFSGLAPFVAQLLSTEGQRPLLPSLYASGIAVIVWLIVRLTRRREIACGI